MRAIILGGTGFIGRELCKELKEHGWEIVVLSRSPGKVADIFGAGVIGMPAGNGDWPGQIDGRTVIVNLAGENIASGRWSGEKKQRILESRLEAGRIVNKAVSTADTPPAALIQASAVGYYGPLDASPVSEDAQRGSGFLASVAEKWEASTLELQKAGVRRCIIRTGMVLGHGGALERMLPAFKFFMGGPPGSGNQPVSWIHMKDEVGAIRFLMENESANGAYNLTAPHPVTFEKFAHVLGDVMGRPHALNAPAFALRLLFGQMADEVLLSGQLALPTRLQAAGYTFRFPELKAAIEDLLA